jgi:HK97 family phage prohead protease
MPDGSVHRSAFSGGIRKFVGVVGPRQIGVIASDATPDRVDDILEPAGCRLENFRKNPIVLAQHDTKQPIARCSSIGVENAKLVAIIDFPAQGVSATSDLYLGLAKAGILSAVSVGFLPIEWEPIRNGGVRYTDWELLELSLVSVPANPSALVTERRLSAPLGRRVNSVARFLALMRGAPSPDIAASMAKAILMVADRNTRSEAAAVAEAYSTLHRVGD